MLVIWGFRSSVRLLAMLNFVCARCGNPAAHRLEERVRRFTLFFIPLFAVSRQTVGTCTFCGLQEKVDKPTRERLLQQAERDGQGGAAVPVEPPYSPTQRP